MKRKNRNQQEETYTAHYFEHFATRENPDSQRNRSRLSALLQARNSGGRLLELGCGMGGFLRLARAYFQVEGLEISAYASRLARDRLGLAVRQGNIETALLPRNAYDVVAAYNILEHLADPPAVLDKIYASLCAGGVLAGSVPNNFALLGGLHTLLTNFFDPTHVSTFTPGRWLDLFHRAGFADVRLFGELLAGPNHCRYVRGRWWAYASFNMMFICKKGAAA
jgi:SAM-dependent methyltransferase